MSSDLRTVQTFTSEKFGDMRTVEIDGEPWFAGKDVAGALGYSNTKDAIATHIDEEDKRILQRSEITTLENHLPKSALPVNFVPANIPNRGLTIINESGLYSLILSSKLPAAKEFKRWVTHDVIPAIRKTGGYFMGEEKMTDEELLAKAFLVSQAKIAERDKRIQELEASNNALYNTNFSLATGICEHEPRYVLRRLAQEYGATMWPWRSRGTQIKFAYGRFYREISDRCHFDVNLRWRRRGEIGKRVDHIKDNEWRDVMKVVVALCVDAGIDIDSVLNGANKRKYAG